MRDLDLGCRCGTVRGVLHDIAPTAGTHLVCYCRDCQAYLRHLRREDLLDPAGGTDIFQTSTGRVAFEEGREHLACLRLSEKGLLRWYASCCNTPVANMPALAAIPFGGFVTACLPDPDRDASIGPVVARYKTESAVSGGGGARRDSGGLTVLRRFAVLTLAARRRGEHRRSPFFDPDTRAPSVSPRILDQAERRAAYR